jgi:HSP20 family protein
MMTLRSTMDRMFDDSLHSMRLSTREDGESAFSLAVDVTEAENEYLVRASTPGIPEEDLEITLENNVLTISGEFESESEQEGVQYLVRERRVGRFRRSITLPATVDEEGISAEFNAGVLSIHLPKAEVAKPKRITIQSQKTIESTAS